MSKAANIYSETAAAVIKSIEEGDVEGQWRMPWHFTGEASVVTPINALTRAPYKGGNIMALWMDSIKKDFTSGYWATYRQWETLGAQVRKGERSTACVKWVVRENPDPTKRSNMFPVGFALFAAEQVDGWVLPDPTPGPEPIEHAEEFFAAVGSKVKTPYPSACYVPLLDFIEMPRVDMFKDSESYYATLAHEHVHWTGHKDRLDRVKGARFADDAYAYEELIAELGSAFLCARLGLSNEPRPDHAQYLKSWARQLKNDPKVLWKAASQAQAAVDFLFEAAGESPSQAAPVASENNEEELVNA